MWENMTSQSIIEMYQALNRGFHLSELDIIWNQDLKKLIWNREFYRANHKILDKMPVEQKYVIFDCLEIRQKSVLHENLQFPYALVDGKLQTAVYTEAFFYYYKCCGLYRAVNLTADRYLLSKSLLTTVKFLTEEKRNKYQWQP